MTKRLLILPFLLILVLGPALLSAQGTIVVTPKKDTAPAAWINHVEGKVVFQNFEKAERDKAVRPGDELNTQNGRVEVELGEGNWIRLDRNTRVVFSDIRDDAAELSLWQGSLYLNLKGFAVKVRSAQEEHLFQDKGLVRVDVDKNRTQIFRDPRVADDFDSWSRSRDQELTNGGSGSAGGRAPLFGGWAFSPFWPWSGYDWYMGFHPLWPYYDPFLWSYYAWPSWYFGWNPYRAWNSWYFGGYPFYGFYAGFGFRDGRSGGNVIRRDQISRPRGAAGSAGRELRPGSTAAGTSGSVYPSRLARAIRPTSSVAGSRTGVGTARSVSPRSSSPRSVSRPGSRSSGGGSISRSGGSARSGGARRR
jgi:hypothetical protein